MLKSACIVVLFSVAATIAAPAQTFNTLVNFNDANGGDPINTTLVQGTDGNFYGTSVGGTNNEGALFNLSSAGALTTLHNFNTTDGSLPEGVALVQGTDGNFYGTTARGGANGEGTVFKITPSGTLTTLHSFNGADGEGPIGGVVLARDGNFYGTTTGGGATSAGTIFRITASGTLTTLHTFRNKDGRFPESGLTLGADGNLYGTTVFGGLYQNINCVNTLGELAYCGAIFKITPGGTFTLLHSFNGLDGFEPFQLTLGADGNLYGMTNGGGLNGVGTVFKITATGSFTSLYSFDFRNSIGDLPYGGLVQATDGNFYGTTGGPIFGTIFEMTPAGVPTLLHTFEDTDGCYPGGSLLQATDGSFYGTTTFCGTSGNGTVYNLGVGLSPFALTRPTSGRVGTKVTILGNNLTGTTAVSFNGTAASFKVLSDSEIATMVPAGATQGTVTVSTPGGTLNSNVVFVVTK